MTNKISKTVTTFEVSFKFKNTQETRKFSGSTIQESENFLAKLVESYNLEYAEINQVISKTEEEKFRIKTIDNR